MGGQDTTQRQRGRTDRKIDTTLRLQLPDIFHVHDFIMKKLWDGVEDGGLELQMKTVPVFRFI